MPVVTKTTGLDRADSTSKRSSTTTARGRGTYAYEACIVCRGKKIKCDGVKPVCSPCTTFGRKDECGWGSGLVRKKQRSEAHFEALRKRADALREYANLLESMLEKCRREHGGGLENGHSYLQFRPVDADGTIFPDEVEAIYEMGNSLGDAEDIDLQVTQELCIPTQNLKLEEGGLLLHGPTAVFRFAYPEDPLQTAGSRFPAIMENPDTSYVLLVDGVHESHYNPDFDWSRHLPSAVPLDRREHDKVLDLLFKFFTSWCLRVVPALFLRDMCRALSVPRSQTPPKTPHYSPMLHNALIALASAFSDDPRIRDFKSREYFANAAKAFIEPECQKPSLSAVHALSILGSYHSSRGDQALGYMYFGMSARTSQALGLNLDCSAWIKLGLITEHDRLDRNWAHWTTFCQDVCWSLYVGRDFSVPIPRSDAMRIPVPFVDSKFDQIPWSYPSANIPEQPNFLSKTFASSCELLMIARRIMDIVNSLNSGSTRQAINDELISDIDLQLNTWKSQLPADVDLTLKTRPTATPHRLMLHLVYWWLFILLHRPFYHRKTRVIHSSDREIDHVKLCKRAADNIMELVITYRGLYTLRYAPITLVQVIFSAGTIFLLSAVQATTGMRVAQKELKHGLDHVKLCVQYLLEIGKSWQCATDIAGILKNLLHQQVKPLLERRTTAAAQVLLLQPPPAQDNVEQAVAGTSSSGLAVPGLPKDSRGSARPLKRSTSNRVKKPVSVSATRRRQHASSLSEIDRSSSLSMDRGSSSSLSEMQLIGDGSEHLHSPKRTRHAVSLSPHPAHAQPPISPSSSPQSYTHSNLVRAPPLLNSHSSESADSPASPTFSVSAPGSGFGSTMPTSPQVAQVSPSLPQHPFDPSAHSDTGANTSRMNTSAPINIPSPSHRDDPGSASTFYSEQNSYPDAGTACPAGMEFSGFLAMLSGHTLPNVPYMPPFSVGETGELALTLGMGVGVNGPSSSSSFSSYDASFDMDGLSTPFLDAYSQGGDGFGTPMDDLGVMMDDFEGASMDWRVESADGEAGEKEFAFLDRGNGYPSAHDPGAPSMGLWGRDNAVSSSAPSTSWFGPGMGTTGGGLSSLFGSLRGEHGNHASSDTGNSGASGSGGRGGGSGAQQQQQRRRQDQEPWMMHFL